MATLIGSRLKNAESKLDSNQIARWFREVRTPQVSPERVLELFFTFHPRTAFLKTLPLHARVADIGAGDGSLSVFRDWPAPDRKDLELYAYSIEKGRLFDEFEAFEISDWNVEPPEFEGVQFDAVVSGHFIEHIGDPGSLAKWMARKVKPGGRAYIEWPSVNSLALPSREELAAKGVDLVISRFADDATHQDLPDRSTICESMRASGFEIESEGVIRMPWIEDQLMANYRDAPDPFPRQAAFWLMTGWSQYIVVRNPESGDAVDDSDVAASPGARLAGSARREESGHLQSEPHTRGFLS